MIIVLRPEASEREVDHIIDRLRELGSEVAYFDGTGTDYYRGDRRRSHSTEPAADRPTGCRERAPDPGALEARQPGI